MPDYTHPAVTGQGRRNTANTAPRGFDITYDDAAAKPWKKKEHQALEILRWVIRNIDSDSVEQHWHLLVPPLLSMVDDHQVFFKARGCELVTLLLRKTPTSLLAKTGLFDVFREALMPCFGFLPTLTPEDESIDLLAHAFPALLALHSVGFPSDHALDARKKIRSTSFLDTLVRKGIFATYAHCPENIHISIVVLQNFSSINDTLGLESVKHLKHSLPLLNEVLCNPFGPASPDLLHTAVLALQSVIRNGWPLMLECRAEVLKGLCVSFINVAESDDSEKFERFRKEAVQAVDMLRQAAKAAKNENRIEDELHSLLDADDRLEALFGQSG